MTGQPLHRGRWFAGGVVTTIGLFALLAAVQQPRGEAGAGAGQRAAPGAVAAAGPRPAPIPEDGKLRIICFGAHPDDCELKAAGVAAKWAAQGHHVKFVSVTNGDVGHWRMAGGPLAQRRTAEVERCAEILGIATEVLDIHDGELLPTLENRKWITKLIREWQADIVMCHRPNDYHPDHRNTGLLVQDAAYMVTVPFFCPDVPHLVRNPVFLYFEDRFQKPNPFSADVVVAIDDVIDRKLAVVEALESQFYEGGCCSNLSELPGTPDDQAARRRTVEEGFRRRFSGTATRFREQLAERYGDAAAGDIGSAEAFEIGEYGRQPTREELRTLFP
ncbi:MAG TPA: PIG-L family deacetylase, partial [Planctomycetaceae bacterium]|nr:PIG-L family deacetylase [Planctomycetaceae bacterium]